MRYLNRIIFINSAHIRYAEIKLDGNVHFIGTQGVGKSTILRAILFFYNADKDHLGIQRGQQKFDDFYLPSHDSYIIYEVVRENGRFFVVTFKNQGRAAFRFVDCAYDRSFFIDGNGDVAYEWPKIHQRIGNHFTSNIIRYYQTYLDIIYGNRKEVTADLRRFSLMESQKYKNVPRSIQNIFLNQSLESRVIKDIIIDSMDFTDSGIDLNFYRSKVKGFKQEYDDIWKWYRKEKNGRIKVRDDADKVITDYTLFEGNRRMIRDLCGELTFAYQRDKNRLPQLNQNINDNDRELQRQKRLFGEEEAKQKTERNKLVGEEAVLKAKLKEIKTKRQHYEAIGIDNIIAKMNDEAVLRTNNSSITAQINAITDKNRSVKEKYDALKHQEKLRLQDLDNKAATDKNSVREEANEQRGKLLKEQQSKVAERNAYWQQQTDELSVTEGSLKDDKHRQELRQQKIIQMNPYKEQMDEYQRKLNDAKASENTLKLKIEQLNKEIDRITAQTSIETEKIKSGYALKQKDMEQEMAACQKQIDELQTLLDRQKGSLIDWLSGNVKGWENNFGKVLDEESVLYNPDLSPQRVADGIDAVFGVKLDIDNIDRKVRTPNDIVKEKNNAEDHLKQLRQDIVNLKQQMEADIKKAEEKPAKRIKELRADRNNADVGLRTIPNIVSSNERLLKETQDKLSQWRNNELDAIKKALTDIETKLQQCNRRQGEVQALKKKDLVKIESEFSKQSKAITDNVNSKIKSIDEATAVHHTEYAKKINLLDAQMDAELRGAGINTDQLSRLRQELQRVNDELQFIEQHRRDFISWQNDKQELFDHEDEFKEQRRQLQQKIDNLDDKFAVRREKYTKAISQLSEAIRGLRETVSAINQSIADVDSFRNSDSCPDELINAQESETVKPLGGILNELRDNIGHKMRLLNSFKEAVVKFKNNFSPQNTFHFRTEFAIEQDYIDFAIELNEFVSNQKIEEYRQRTSNVYVEIMQRISREVNDLMNHKGTIEHTISDINRDFKENNFAGVIKDIELRSVESNEPLMQLLLSVARFAEDNSFNIGDVNLFTDQDTLAKNNQRAVELLMNLMDTLDVEQKRETITLADTFKLEFKVRENDNDTGWVEKLSNVGSDGTDVLVKAMVNIMLINVFKRKVSRKFGDFRIHCLMDEIGKLHPNNVKGILDFANKRNILLINSSPTTYTAEAYRYTYSLSKDAKSNTIVNLLLTIK